MEPEIIKFIKGKQTVLEQYPLEKLSKLKKLGAYKHFGFWQCVDTIRDKEILEQAIKEKYTSERKNSSCRWYWFYWISRIKKSILKKYFLYSLSKNNPKSDRKVKNVKYIFCNIINKKI